MAEFFIQQILRLKYTNALVSFFVLMLFGNVSLASVSLASVSRANEAPVIRIATTTSTYHSGLLDYLLQKFNKYSDIKVQVIAVGTGQALRLGAQGDVDLVLTHAPEAEAAFVEQGFGIEPQAVMYNDFIIVGPPQDPAKLNGLNEVSQGLQAIATSNRMFLSRGDDSGTHKKEQQLWSLLEQGPDFTKYLESGRGMGQTLQMASELQSYTLTDRGTWLALEDKLDLAIVLQSDPRLINPYQIILVNPQHHPHVNFKAARVFADWLTGTQGQAAIEAFTINGQVLFIPNAI